MLPPIPGGSTTLVYHGLRCLSSLLLGFLWGSVSLRIVVSSRRFHVTTNSAAPPLEVAVLTGVVVQATTITVALILERVMTVADYEYHGASPSCDVPDAPVLYYPGIPYDSVLQEQESLLLSDGENRPL